MMKKIALLVMSAGMSIIMAITIFAAGWEKNIFGWWYWNDDNTYPHDGWEWIDGDNDGSAECYYFDEDGYLLMNTITPDGYMVNADGAWIENGEIQKTTYYSSEAARILALAYYDAKYPSQNGSYDIFSEETRIEGDKFIFTVRWQMSDKEIEKRLNEGLTVAPNIYENTLIFYRTTGEIEEDWGL